MVAGGARTGEVAEPQSPKSSSAVTFGAAEVLEDPKPPKPDSMAGDGSPQPPELLEAILLAAAGEAPQSD